MNKNSKTQITKIGRIDQTTNSDQTLGLTSLKQYTNLSLICQSQFQFQLITYLRPDLKRENFTNELIINVLGLLGNKYTILINYSL